MRGKQLKPVLRACRAVPLLMFCGAAGGCLSQFLMEEYDGSAKPVAAIQHGSAATRRQVDAAAGMPVRVVESDDSVEAVYRYRRLPQYKGFPNASGMDVLLYMMPVVGQVALAGRLAIEPVVFGVMLVRQFTEARWQEFSVRYDAEGHPVSLKHDNGQWQPVPVSGSADLMGPLPPSNLHGEPIGRPSSAP